MQKRAMKEHSSVRDVYICSPLAVHFAVGMYGYSYLRHCHRDYMTVLIEGREWFLSSSILHPLHAAPSKAGVEPGGRHLNL